MTSFATLSINERLRSNSKLAKLAKLINWPKLNKHLTKIHKNDINPVNGGRRSYDSLAMFKLILLGQWNSLSDAELEYAILIRLDFISFCGFNIDDNVPDETTICRFRNKLIRQGLIDKLFAEVNIQLEDLNLKVKKADMAIVDATIIESNSRPQMKTLEEIPNDREEMKLISNSNKEKGEEKGEEKEIKAESKYQENTSSDPDAKWLKKGKKSYYGYKSFATVDEEGYVLKTHTTPANEAEVNKLEILIKNINAKRMSGDKAYDSKKNRELLKNNNIKSGLMFKAKKNKPLTRWQKKFNKLVSKKRFRVEQTFGTMKRILKFRKASYFTTKKVQAQFTMKAICINLLKAVNKVELVPPRLLMG